MSLESMIAYHIHWGCVYGNNRYHRSHYQRQYHNTISLLKMRRLIKSLLGFLYISWPFNSQPKPSNKIGKTKWKNSMSWEFSPLQKELSLSYNLLHCWSAARMYTRTQTCSMEFNHKFIVKSEPSVHFQQMTSVEPLHTAYWNV